MISFNLFNLQIALCILSSFSLSAAATISISVTSISSSPPVFSSSQSSSSSQKLTKSSISTSVLSATSTKSTSVSSSTATRSSSNSFSFFALSTSTSVKPSTAPSSSSSRLKSSSQISIISSTSTKISSSVTSVSSAARISPSTRSSSSYQTATSASTKISSKSKTAISSPTLVSSSSRLSSSSQTLKTSSTSIKISSKSVTAMFSADLVSPISKFSTSSQTSLMSSTSTKVSATSSTHSTSSSKSSTTSSNTSKSSKISSSSSSSSSSSTTSATIVATGFPKRGLVYNTTSKYIENWNGNGSQVNWAYNWDSIIHDTFPKYLEFVPMLWGPMPVHTGYWFQNANYSLETGSSHLLAFNEPDGCGGGQSCISPADAAVAYHTYMMPYAKRASLGAPAVTNGPSGLPWLKEFLGNCTGCQIDFVPLHWYNRWNNTGYLHEYLEAAYVVGGGRKLWLTEFNASGNTTEQITFLKEAIPRMDERDWVERYCWYLCSPESQMGSIVDENGDPTEMGNVYAYTPY